MGSTNNEHRDRRDDSRTRTHTLALRLSPLSLSDRSRPTHIHIPRSRGGSGGAHLRGKDDASRDLNFYLT